MNPQPVSLADELRKLPKMEAPLGDDTGVDWVPLGEVLALLAQHAVAEPQKPICPTCMSRDDVTPFTAEDNTQMFGCARCMMRFRSVGWQHAAEQPKLTADQVREISEASAELQHFAAQVTEVTPPLTVHLEAIQIAMERVVDKLNALLTSPVAPPPQQKEKK